MTKTNEDTPVSVLTALISPEGSGIEYSSITGSKLPLIIQSANTMQREVWDDSYPLFETSSVCFRTKIDEGEDLDPELLSFSIRGSIVAALEGMKGVIRTDLYSWIHKATLVKPGVKFISKQRFLITAFGVDGSVPLAQVAGFIGRKNVHILIMG